MTEAEFLERWRAEKPVYEAWGDLVLEHITQAYRELETDLDFEYFVKIKPVPRLKRADSLLGKAFHRPEKRYDDPYLQIEDKVGLRFVVLLTGHIRLLQGLIESCPLWEHSLDRDFEREREERPTEFAYQSKHYVLKAARDIDWHSQRIPQGTPCEVQLRTLLQHAHSELTHDNIYKVQSGTSVTNKVHRTVAKSMALIEAVDDFFERALKEMDEATADEREALAVLTALYLRRVGLPPGADRTNQIVVHAYREHLGTDLLERLTQVLDEKPFIVRRIQERYERSLAFRQPWILLVYCLAVLVPRQAAELWPLTPDELTPVLTDIGA